MELWIRSQDKIKLVKVNYVYIMESDNHFTIYGETIDSSPIIGTYKTKERALKVLDEIQNIILLQSMYKYDNNELIKAWAELSQEEIKILRTQISVYEMSKE